MVNYTEKKKTNQNLSLQILCLAIYMLSSNVEVQPWNHHISLQVGIVIHCWQVNAQDLEDTYQPPFKTCIQEARASCLMCAYNQVNGVPMCAHKDLLQKTRDEWGFQGYATCSTSEFASVETWTTEYFRNDKEHHYINHQIQHFQFCLPVFI